MSTECPEVETDETYRLPDPRRQPTLSLEEAARLFGVSRAMAYDLANRGQFPGPILKIGSRWRVPTAPALAMLGLDEAGRSPG